MNKSIKTALVAATLAFGLAVSPVVAHADLLMSAHRLLTPSPGDGKLAKLAFVLDEDFAVTSIAWSPDGRYIADAGTLSATINVWSVDQRRVIKHFDALGGNAYFHSLTFSPDSKWLALCSNASLFVYSVADWRPVHVQDKPDGFCQSRVAFSDDGKQLAVDGRELVIISTSDWSNVKMVDSAWRRGKGTKVFVFVPGTHDLLIGGGDRFPDYPGQKNAPDGGVLWALADDETVPSRRITVYPPDPESHFNSDVISIAVNHEGKQVVTGATTGNGSGGQTIRSAICILDFQSGRVIARPLDGVARSHQSGIAYSSDGKYLIVGDNSYQSPKVYLVATSSLTKMDTIELSESAYDVAANPTGNGFAVATGSRIGIWKMN